jgi:hypothetical protein
MLPSLTSLQAPGANPVPVDAYLDRELASLIAHQAQSLHGVLSFEVVWRQIFLTGLHLAYVTISLNIETHQESPPTDWVAAASAAGVAAMCNAGRQFYAENRGEGLQHCREGRGWCGTVKPLERGWASAADATQTPLNVQLCTFTDQQMVEFEALCDALANAEENQNLDVALVTERRNAVLNFLNPLVRGPIAAFANAFVGGAPRANMSREFEPEGFRVSMGSYAFSEEIVNLPDMSDLNLPSRYVDHAHLTYDFPFTLYPSPDSDALETVTRLLTDIEFYNPVTDGERSQ